MTGGIGPSIRGRVADLAAIAAAGLVGLLVVADAQDSGRLAGDAVFWALVIAGLGCGALWWRRRHPVGVAVALLPLAAVTDAAGGAVLIAIYTIAASRRWPTAAGLGGLHALAAVPYSAIRPDPRMTLAAAQALSVALLAGAVLAGLAARSRRNELALARERAARAETEARLRAERLRSAERQSIAREMHDVLAHQISLVSLHAGALEIRPDLTAAEVARSARTIRSSAHRALEELRDILGVLRTGPPEAEPLQPPGLAGLDQLVAECRSAGTAVALDNRLPRASVPALACRTVYRVVQEGLTNARKHAPGSPVRVRLDRTPAGDLHAHLSNPLSTIPGSAVPGAGAGLAGLAERTGLAGGRLDHGIRRGPDGEIAFHLEAWLPWTT